MGNKQSENNTKEGIVNINPTLSNIKKFVDKGRVYLQYKVTNVHQKQYHLWKQSSQSLHKINTQPFFLPINSSFNIEGMCSNTGTTTVIFYQQIIYQNVPHWFHQDILNRVNDKQLYGQKQLWYILYTLCFGVNELQKINNRIGDVRPKNILVDQNGCLKVILAFSFPKQLTNYQKIIQQRQVCYLCNKFQSAPQEMQNLQKKHYLPQLDNMADSYSIGMTCLEAAVLMSSQDLYDFNKFQINYNKMNERVGLISKNYFPFFQKCIKNMLKINKDHRASAEVILAILSSYQSEIQNFQPFVPSKRKCEEALKKISFNDKRLYLIDQFFDDELSFQPSNFSKSKMEQKRVVSKIPTDPTITQESKKHSRFIQDPRESQTYYKHQTVQKPLTPATRQQQKQFSAETGYVKTYNNPSFQNAPNSIPITTDMTYKKEKIQRHFQPKKIVFTPSSTSYQKNIQTNYQQQEFYYQTPPSFSNQPYQNYINQKSYMNPSFQNNQGMTMINPNQPYGNQGFQSKQVFVSSTPKVQGQQNYLSAYNPRQNQPQMPQLKEYYNIHPIITNNLEKEGKNEQTFPKKQDQNLTSIYNQKIYFAEKQQMPINYMTTYEYKNEPMKRTEFQGKIAEKQQMPINYMKTYEYKNEPMKRTEFQGKILKQVNYRSENQVSKQLSGMQNKLINIKPIFEAKLTQTKYVVQGSEITPCEYELQKRYRHQN